MQGYLQRLEYAREMRGEFSQSYVRHTVVPKGAIVEMPNTEPITFQDVDESAADHSRPRPFPVVGAMQVPAHEELARFEHAVLPHLAAAYNLARWLTRDEQDAQDVVQEAYVRAWTFFDRFHGEDGRAWLLTIVRHTGYTWLQRHRRQELATAFDEEQHSGEREDSNPETLLLQQANQQLLREALEALPVEYREVIVLRELEGLSYKEIAGIADLPLGTVMSRLARACQRLLVWLTERRHEEI